MATRSERTSASSDGRGRAVEKEEQADLKWAHYVVITNLVLAVVVLMLCIAALFKAIVNSQDSEPSHGILGKVYCISSIEWSLFTEFFAQFLYTVGSALLFLWAFNNNQLWVYVYGLFGVLYLFMATLIRSLQYTICEATEVPLLKNAFWWLLGQIVWYLIVLCLAVYTMKLIKTEHMLRHRKVSVSPLWMEHRRSTSTIGDNSSRH